MITKEMYKTVWGLIQQTANAGRHVGDGQHKERCIAAADKIAPMVGYESGLKLYNDCMEYMRAQYKIKRENGGVQHKVYKKREPKAKVEPVSQPTLKNVHIMTTVESVVAERRLSIEEQVSRDIEAILKTLRMQTVTAVTFHTEYQRNLAIDYLVKHRPDIVHVRGAGNSLIINS